MGIFMKGMQKREHFRSTLIINKGSLLLRPVTTEIKILDTGDNHPVFVVSDQPQSANHKLSSMRGIKIKEQTHT